MRGNLSESHKQGIHQKVIGMSRERVSRRWGGAGQTNSREWPFRGEVGQKKTLRVYKFWEKMSGRAAVGGRAHLGQRGKKGVLLREAGVRLGASINAPGLRKRGDRTSREVKGE